jgi:hypothetical protein
MKALTLSELVKVLSTPENQPMGILADACKQAAQFIRNEKVIYEKAEAFAKLFSDKKFDTLDSPPPEPESPTGSIAREGEPRQPAPRIVDSAPVKGKCNLYVTGLRPVKTANGKADRIEMLRILRDASGELNAAPRMTMQKANELLADLELGDRDVFIYTYPHMEDAAEVVKDLASVGIIAEVRN